mmetsp:Transcript_17894/g.26801  ORF Transcript_17894/g.26801 Transcript_17894/m.26801 type:complete len:404 (-) Transcript_17894:280-1491(-)
MGTNKLKQRKIPDSISNVASLSFASSADSVSSVPSINTSPISKTKKKISSLQSLTPHIRWAVAEIKRRKKNIKPKHVIWLLCLLLKLVIGLFLLAVMSFSIYLYCMSLYNGRSVRDPCWVAQDSKERMYQSLAEVKRDVSVQTNQTHIATVAMAKTAAMTMSMSSFEEVVPKIIHQQWKDDNVPKKFMKWRKKWLALYPEPEYKHMLWTDKNGRELIVEHYPWFLETYDGYKHNINRADAARYFILHYYGGIYADLDYEAQSNFYEFLPPNQVAMVESPYYWNEKTQNCLMSSPKHDPFWVDLFAVLMKNAEREEVLEATGPILLDQAMEYSVHPSYILPCENFQRVPLGEYDQTLWTTIYDREIMFRLKPISKNCGYYSNDQCHFGRHHNTVSYRTTTGKVL